MKILEGSVMKAKEDGTQFHPQFGGPRGQKENRIQRQNVISLKHRYIFSVQTGNWT